MKNYYKYLIFIWLITLASYASSIDVLKRACEIEHNIEQCYKLGVAYSKGVGVSQNPTYAKKYLSLACNHGLEIACTALKGVEPTKRNDTCEKAFTRYTKLATSSMKGNREEALKMYREACINHKQSKVREKKTLSSQTNNVNKGLDTTGVDGIVDIDPSEVEDNVKYLEALKKRTEKEIEEHITHFKTLKKHTENVDIKSSCIKDKEFLSLLDLAEVQTEEGHYKKALEIYRKAYRICPIKDLKDLEKQLSWLAGED